MNILQYLQRRLRMLYQQSQILKLYILNYMLLLSLQRRQRMWNQQSQIHYYKLQGKLMMCLQRTQYKH